MRVAYVDTSCLVAVALGEEGHEEVAAGLEEYDLLVSSNLLEAELRSALAREEVEGDPTPLLGRLTWLHPERALSAEFREVLDHGYARGADLWHLGCALLLRRSLATLDVATLDGRQRTLAERLGLGAPGLGVVG